MKVADSSSPPQQAVGALRRSFSRKGSAEDASGSVKYKISRKNSLLRTGLGFKYSQALEGVRAVEEEQVDLIEEVRVALNKFMQTSPIGQAYDNFDVIISVLSTFQFIYQTYLDETSVSHDYMYYYNIGFSSVFGFDFLLNLFRADHRITYLFSFYSLLDMVIIITTIWTANNTSGLIVKSTSDAIRIGYYVIYALRTVRILRALRVLKQMRFIGDAVERYIAELSVCASVALLFYAALIQYLESFYSLRHFHTWLYYATVTVASVGYGDISPKSTTGRIAAMAMIGFAVISVPKVTNELIEKMNLQSVYMRASYAAKGINSKHVVICGDISSTALDDFFAELFHEDHENTDLTAVLLLPHPPMYEVTMLLRDRRYAPCVVYLEGSALAPADLARAKTECAMAVFIMSNKFATNPDEEDAKAILLNLSIKRYLAGFSRSSVSICMQLIRPENRQHIARSGVSSIDENDMVVCLNQIKMGTMAKAVLYPGANTLLMNLVTSFSDDEPIRIDDATTTFLGMPINGKSASTDVRSWIEEYQAGCGWEIYMTPISRVFEGAKFCELSYALYDRIGVVIFAIQIQDLKEGGPPKLLLNPADYCIPNQDEFVIQAFVIAKNKASSDLSSVGNDGRTIEVTPLQRMNRNISSLASIIGDKFERRKSTLLRDTRIYQLSASMEPSAEGSNRNKKVSKWKQLKRRALLQRKVQSNSFQEVLHSIEQDHIQKNYYISQKQMELANVTIRTNVVDEVPFINHHIIVIGKGFRNIYDLIRPIRAKHLGTLRYIVLLSPQEIPHEVWQRISIFDAILFVRGSPLEENNLRRAGIFRASQVVVLADGEKSQMVSQGMEALVDSDAIFTYQHVKRMNPRVQVVVEMVKQSNIGYLSDDEIAAMISEVTGDDPKFSPPFASGCLFPSSVLDSIVCQTYYNPHIINVLHKLICGQEHLERADLLSMTSKKLAEEAAAEYGNSLNNDDEDEEENREVKQKNSLQPTASTKNLVKEASKQDQGRLNLIPSSCLYQISVPDHMHLQTYGQFYQQLSAQGIIPLGLLRGIPSGHAMGPRCNRMPYVYTNPEKTTILYDCDLVFVLSTKPEFVKEQKDIKDWIWALQMQNRHGESSGKMNWPMLRPGSATAPAPTDKPERARKKMEEKVKRFTADINKKLEAIVGMMEQKFSLSNPKPTMTVPSENTESRSRKFSQETISSLGTESTDNNKDQPSLTNENQANDSDEKRRRHSASSLLSPQSSPSTGILRKNSRSLDPNAPKKRPSFCDPLVKDDAPSNSSEDTNVQKARRDTMHRQMSDPTGTNRPLSAPAPLQTAQSAVRGPPRRTTFIEKKN